MRTFLIALAVLVLTLGVCVWNFVYLNRTTEDFLATAETLPAADVTDADFARAADILADLRADWDREKRMLSLGTSYETLATVELALATAEAAATASDEAEFLAARGALLLAARRLMTLEHSFF